MMSELRSSRQKFREVSRLDIERHLEVVREHILPVVELVVHLVLAVVEEEQLIAAYVRGRLFVDRIGNNRELERLEHGEIGEVPGAVGHDRSFAAVPSARVVALTRGRERIGRSSSPLPRRY